MLLYSKCQIVLFTILLEIECNRIYEKTLEKLFNYILYLHLTEQHKKIIHIIQ